MNINKNNQDMILLMKNHYIWIPKQRIILLISLLHIVKILMMMRLEIKIVM